MFGFQNSHVEVAFPKYIFFCHVKYFSFHARTMLVLRSLITWVVSFFCNIKNNSWTSFAHSLLSQELPQLLTSSHISLKVNCLHSRNGNPSKGWKLHKPVLCQNLHQLIFQKICFSNVFQRELLSPNFLKLSISEKWPSQIKTP